MADTERTSAAAYVSWKTFQNSIETLAGAVIPNVIDKKVFPGTAFGVQAQLFSGMRFLGLIDDKNKPTPELEQLANPSEEERKKKLREILQLRYSELFALNLKKTTPDELEKKLAEAYNVGGDTKGKALRFFVSAAKYVGIELSPYVLKSSNGLSRSGAPRKPRAGKKSPPPPADPPPAQSDTSKTIRLQSGGTLTVSSTVGLFALKPDDRKFLFELIDRLDSYKEPGPEPTTGEESPE
jgi:Family of unknown function (DUF5343)